MVFLLIPFRRLRPAVWREIFEEEEVKKVVSKMNGSKASALMGFLWLSSKPVGMW